MKTRIAIVEDDPNYRTGLAALLQVEPSFVVQDAFVQAADAGITAQASRPETASPKIDGPAAVDAVDFVWEDEIP